MKPGATINPVASKTSAPWGTLPFPDGATSCIFSPFRRTSRAASVLEAGSRTRPFLIRSIGGFLGFHFERRMRVALGSSGKEEIKNGHARSEEHTSELQSLAYLVCRLLLEKKKKKKIVHH